MNAIEHEIKFVESFIRKEKRERYSLALKGSAKHRKKILDKFYHSLIMHLLPECIIHLNSSLQSIISIRHLLLSKNAPLSCYLMGNSELDKKTIALDDALNMVVGYDSGTVISCIPGKLAYYEAEGKNCRYILEKK